MNNFSPNMLKTFAVCPKKYYFKYVQNISMPQPASFFEKGKKIHALAHYYLQGADISNMLNALDDDEKFLWQRLNENEFFQKKYVNSEYNLSAKIGDFWVGGRLDALMCDCPLQEDENEPLNINYFILDYKTGSIPKNPETDFQTMVYLICADKKLKDYKSLKFIYIDLRNNKNAVIELTEERKKVYKNALAEFCLQISQTAEYPQNIDNCRFCEYSKICDL